MRVPRRFNARTNNVAPQQNFINDNSAAILAQGQRQLAQGISAFGAAASTRAAQQFELDDRAQRVYDAEQEKLQREYTQVQEREKGFSAGIELDNFKTSVQQKVFEAKENATGPMREFTGNLGKIYDEASEKFLEESIPAELHPEYRKRLSGVRLQVMSDALVFEYGAKHKYYNENVAVGLDKLKGEVDSKPETLEAAAALLQRQLPSQTRLAQISSHAGVGLRALTLQTAEALSQLTQAQDWDA